MLTSLLYCCETWTLYRKHVRQLERFHVRSLRSLIGIRWQDRVTDIAVLDRAGILSIEAMIIKVQLRWTGHLIRIDSFHIQRQLIYGVLAQGHRNLGRRKKCYKDCAKE